MGLRPPLTILQEVILVELTYVGGGKIGPYFLILRGFTAHSIFLTK